MWKLVWEGVGDRACNVSVWSVCACVVVVWEECLFGEWRAKMGCGQASGGGGDCGRRFGREARLGKCLWAASGWCRVGSGHG